MNAAKHGRLDRTRIGIGTLLLALAAVAGFALGGASLAMAQAEEGTTPPESETVWETTTEEQDPASEGTEAGEKSGVTLSAEPFHYTAPIVDSLFSVGPAEFLGIDMPADPPDAKAVRLVGTIQVEGKGDIMVRLFRGPEYQNWLKKRGGRKADPYWTSKRLRTIHMDHPLVPGTPVVLLIDNGYSVRTPKRVKTRLQIQYERTGAAPATTASGTHAPVEDDFIVPRSDTEEVVPPPPPPPPSDAGGE
jgi:hypothetical protein